MSERDDRLRAQGANKRTHEIADMLLVESKRYAKSQDGRMASEALARVSNDIRDQAEPQRPDEWAVFLSNATVERT